jgi:AbrB family looped-hinge helix DNA binding protein
MKHIATMTSKGQITVPVNVRNSLGLKAGDRLAFISQNGEIILRLDRGRKIRFQPMSEFLVRSPKASKVSMRG